MTEKDIEICVPLKGDLGLKDSRGVLQCLGEALDIFDHVNIDARDVTDVDISIVQLLVAVRKSASRQGKSLTLHCAAGGSLAGALGAAGLPVPGGDGRWAEDAFGAGSGERKGTGEL